MTKTLVGTKFLSLLMIPILDDSLPQIYYKRFILNKLAIICKLSVRIGTKAEQQYFITVAEISLYPEPFFVSNLSMVPRQPH